MALKVNPPAAPQPIAERSALFQQEPETRSVQRRILDQAFKEALDKVIQSKIRPLTQWLPEEIIMPAPGPAANERYSFDSQPVQRIIAEQIDSGRWREIYLQGPSQSGKTLICFFAPVVYFSSEMAEPLVLGIPDQAMGDDKFKMDILPPMESSPALRTLIPSKGPGSKGGKIKDVMTWTTGVRLRVMSKGGSDQRRAGYTSRIIVVTEAAGWSEGTASSREADPLEQLKARQEAFDGQGEMLIVEGTVQEKDVLPWSAREDSTESRIVSECPICGEWVMPEREHLRGWQDAKSSGEAVRLAHFVCPECGEAIDDEMRTEMVRAAKILHKGEHIDDNGEVAGECIDTNRLWLGYSAWHNLFTTIGKLGEKEWRLAQVDPDSPAYQEKLKALLQFTWAQPYDPAEALEIRPLEDADVKKHEHEELPRHMLPDDTTHLVCPIDMGLRTGWYVLLAGTERGVIHVVDYGPIDIEATEETFGAACHKALKSHYRRMMRGFRHDASRDGVFIPTAMPVDSRYMTNQVIKAIHAICRRNRNAVMMPIFGEGRGQYYGNKTYRQPKKLGNGVIEIGDNWHLQISKNRGDRNRPVSFDIMTNADHWKDIVQQAYRLKPGARGSICLFNGPANTHRTFRRHMTNEQFSVKVEKRGEVGSYERTGDQHYFDCLVYGLVALDRAGFKTYQLPDSAQ